MRGSAFLGIWLVSCLMMVGSSDAQQPAPVGQGERIPGGPSKEEPFRSWSLFLVCDPAWLHDKAALQGLHLRYKAFGDTTGPTHAAVWFEKSDGALDIKRGIGYCRKFALVPSEGPHIVVTTIHPDSWQPNHSKVVLAFGGRSPGEIQAQLTKLNDQIAVERLSQEELNSARWWQGWVRAVEGTCRWFDKVKWSVDAKALKVERSGVC
jgi:hypothetical protein